MEKRVIKKNKEKKEFEQYVQTKIATEYNANDNDSIKFFCITNSQWNEISLLFKDLKTKSEIHANTHFRTVYNRLLSLSEDGKRFFLDVFIHYANNLNYSVMQCIYILKETQYFTSTDVRYFFVMIKQDKFFTKFWGDAVKICQIEDQVSHRKQGKRIDLYNGHSKESKKRTVEDTESNPSKRIKLNDDVRNQEMPEVLKELIKIFEIDIEVAQNIQEKEKQKINSLVKKFCALTNKKQFDKLFIKNIGWLIENGISKDIFFQQFISFYGKKAIEYDRKSIVEEIDEDVMDEVEILFEDGTVTEVLQLQLEELNKMFSDVIKRCSQWSGVLNCIQNVQELKILRILFNTLNSNRVTYNYEDDKLEPTNQITVNYNQPGTSRQLNPESYS
jgi:hypothetical protein